MKKPLVGLAAALFTLVILAPVTIANAQTVTSAASPELEQALRATGWDV